MCVWRGGGLNEPSTGSISQELEPNGLKKLPQFASHPKDLDNSASQLELLALADSEPSSWSVSQVAQLASQLKQLASHLIQLAQLVSTLAQLAHLESHFSRLASQLAQLASQLAAPQTAFQSKQPAPSYSKPPAQVSHLASQVARLVAHLAKQLASDLVPQSGSQSKQPAQLFRLAKLASDLAPQSGSQSGQPAPSDSEPPAQLSDRVSKLAQHVADLANQLAEIESQSSRSHKALQWKVGIVAALVLLLAASQPTMLVVLTYVLPRSCAVNSTQILNITNEVRWILFIMCKTFASTYYVSRK